MKPADIVVIILVTSLVTTLVTIAFKTVVRDLKDLQKMISKNIEDLQEYQRTEIESQTTISYEPPPSKILPEFISNIDKQIKEEQARIEARQFRDRMHPLRRNSDPEIQ